MKLLQKMRGSGDAPPPRSSWPAILATTLAVTAVVATLMYLTGLFEVVLMLGSFAPTALIVFAYPDSPFAQPRNVVLGHLIGSACGLASAQGLPERWWGGALAVGAAIGLMKAARAVHPPACANPLIIHAFLRTSWTFLLFPTLTGAGLIVVAALLYHNLRRADPWPRYWL
jgi:CBS-domain-containing membrane protein